MTRTCNKCGTVAFSVTREHALLEVEQFNIYYNSLTKEEQNNSYKEGGAHIEFYEFCRCGNNHKNFREAKEGDCPEGCTLSPIIFEEL